MFGTAHSFISLMCSKWTALPYLLVELILGMKYISNYLQVIDLMGGKINVVTLYKIGIYYVGIYFPSALSVASEFFEKISRQIPFCNISQVSFQFHS